MRKSITIGFAVLFFSLMSWSQTGTGTDAGTAKSAKPAASGEPTAIFDTTVGKLTCKLFEKETPITVANFIGLATGTKDWKNPVSGAVEQDVSGSPNTLRDGRRPGPKFLGSMDTGSL